jgi:DNA primase
MQVVLDALDLGEPNHQGKMLAPWREEHTPSLHIYEDGSWYDYGTGEGGDALDFVIRYHECSFLQARNFIAQVMDSDPEDFKESVARVPKPKPVTDFTDQFDRAGWCTQRDLEWWKEMVTAKWPSMPHTWPLTNFGVSLARSAALIPHWADGRIVGVKTRNLATGEKKAWSGSTFTTQLYKPTAGDETDSCPVLLVEGESDCWTASYALRECQVQVRALPCGASTIRRQWFEDFVDRRVFVCFDSDAAGGLAEQTVLESLSGALGRRPIALPDGVKDVSEALAGGWDIRKALGL